MIETIALSFSVGLGAVVVWEDLLRQRISNRRILAGLAFSAAGFLALALRGGEPALPFLLRLSEHLALSVAAALALWYMRVWPAGDAKLFIAFSCLTVVVKPAVPGFPSYLFLKLLVNTFVPAGVFVAALVLVEWGRWLSESKDLSLASELRAKAEEAAYRLRDEWRNRWSWAMLAWNLFVVFLFFQAVRTLVQPLAREVLPQVILYLALLLLWDGVSALFVRKTTAAVSLCAATAVLLPLWTWRHLDAFAQLLGGLKLTGGFAAFMTAARLALVQYLARARVVRVAPDELRAGMILPHEARSALGRAAPVRVYPDGLSAREVGLIRRRAARRRLESLPVYTARGFALWIFFGFLWTVFSKQNAVQWLISSFHRL